MRSNITSPLASPTPPALLGFETPTRAGRLEAGVLRDLPGPPRPHGLRQRRDLVGAAAHRGEHRVDRFAGEIVDELEVDLRARRAVAGRQALDLFVRDQPVGRRLEMLDAELLAARRP